MIAPVVKLFKALNTNSHPGEIAHAASIGILLGFVPKNNALWYILFVFFLFVRIHKGTLFLSILLGTLIAPLFDPLLDALGYAVLNIGALKPAYAALLEIPFVAFTKFNNTIVAGSLTASLILYIPVYILTRFLVSGWRKFAAPALAQNKFVQALYKTPLAAKIAGFFTEVEL
ncbi:TIGR03546 family protein [Treponema sp. OMZ 840]|uniref:TIGR03546 family protein n=1 Tax=Treponema sp. OMZ 840 TaxID=244313 RepID=UPI003D8AD129